MRAGKGVTVGRGVGRHFAIGGGAREGRLRRAEWWHARQTTARNALAIPLKGSVAGCAGPGFNRGQPSATLRQVERVVFKIVRHLMLEPQVDAQRRLVNLLIVSGVADRALFLGLVLQILGHCLPPAAVLETRVSPSADNCKPGVSGQGYGNLGIQRAVDWSIP